MRLRYILVALLIGGVACNKDNKCAPAAPAPVITKLNHDAVQPGDTLVITGQYLKAGSGATEVMIGDKPLTMVHVATDSVVTIVPAATLSGSLVLYVGAQTIQGPALTVYFTPEILSFSPLLLSAGDTIWLKGNNFASAPEDNHITLGNASLQIVTVTQHELKAVLPVDATSGVLHWQTYSGPVYNYKDILGVRSPVLSADNVMDYLRQDAGFSKIYAYLQNQIANPPNNGTLQSALDTLVSYLTGNEPVTLCIPNNNYTRGSVLLESILGISTYGQYSYDAWQLETPYPSILTGAYIYQNPLYRDYFKITLDGEGHKVITTLVGSAPLEGTRLGRERKVGNVTFYEIDEVPQSDSQPLTP